MVLFSGQTLNSLVDEVAGVTAVTMERANAVALTAGTSGTLYAALVTLPPGITVNNLDFWMVGASTTPAHQWMVLLSPGSASTVLAVTADNTAGQAANTYYRAPVTVPFVTPPGAPSQYYIGVMLASATPGTVAGGPAVPTMAGAPAGTLQAFVTGTATGQTTPPALGTAVLLSTAAGTSANIYAATA